jgi:predicted nucleic acid-binding protein
MRTSSEAGLLDTNILVYAHDTLSPHYDEARELRDRASRGELPACISPQNILEFYSVVTNPRKLKNPLTPQQALREVEIYLNSRGIAKIYPIANTIFRTVELMRHFGVRRENTFDVYLIATMLDNGIRLVYTEDTSHFEKYGLLDVINPFI